MNKLDTNNNGGFPLTLNDFRFIDDSVRLALYDICGAFGITGAVILYGCQVQQQGNYMVVSEGAILNNGEIWHVFPHNFSIPNGFNEAPYWNFIEQNDPAGSKVFFDGVTHQVYKVRKATGSAVPDPAAITSIQMDGLSRLPDLSESVADLTLAPGAVPSNNAYREIVLKRGRMANLELSVYCPINGTTLLATIPDGYRPTAYLTGICFDLSSGSLFRYTVDKDNGRIVVSLLSGDPVASGTFVIQISYII